MSRETDREPLYEGIDYAEFWTGPEKAHIDRLEQRVICSLLPGGEAIAEIGAGFGRLTGSYLGRYARVCLVEPASNMRELLARDFGDRAEVVDASVYRLPFGDGQFDGLLMVRVMHHLTEPTAAIAELRRVLRPGGLLLFSYSNKRNLGRVLRYLVTRRNDPFSLDVEAYGETLFGHHPRRMERWLEEAGFVVERRAGVGLVGKVVGVLPFLRRVSQPPLFLAMLAGSLEISPTQFLLVRRR